MTGKIHAFIRLYSVQATKLYKLSDKPRNKSKFYALIFWHININSYLCKVFVTFTKADIHFYYA